MTLVGATAPAPPVGRAHRPHPVPLPRVLPELQGQRGLAALAIVLFHISHLRAFLVP